MKELKPLYVQLQGLKDAIKIMDLYNCATKEELIALRQVVKEYIRKQKTQLEQQSKIEK